MPTCATPDLAPALAEAILQIERRCFTDRHRERAYDACVDAILRAAQLYSPALGPFAAYVAVFVDQAICSVILKPLPLRDQASHLGDQSESLSTRGCCTVQHQRPFQDLPDELRVICTLHIVHGYSYEEIGLMLGCSKATIHERVRSAAELLAAP